jgi:hypothetical protein
MPPALHDRLMEPVVSAPNMRRARQRVKANHGAPGSDGMRVEDLPAFARERLANDSQATDRWQLSSAGAFRKVCQGGKFGVRTKLIAALFAVLFLWVSPSTSVRADPYPSQPIRIVVPGAAGGVLDVNAQRLSDTLIRSQKQPVVVDNRPGANGFIGAAAANPTVTRCSLPTCRSVLLLACIVPACR